MKVDHGIPKPGFESHIDYILGKYVTIKKIHLIDA